jgi:DNA mismatch repair protein MutS2
MANAGGRLRTTPTGKLVNMTIPAKTLKTLEYDKVIERLAKHAITLRGRELALALLPATEFGEVVRRQRFTAEARRLIELKPNVSLSDVKDVASIVRQAALERVLEPQELLDVQTTLAAARVVHETIDKLRGYMRHIAETANRIGNFSEITTEIGRAISNRGEVMDSASPQLHHLRRESRIVHDRLRSRLESILASQAGKGALQDPIITLRDGRYVVPVKADARSQMPGIVHDVSSSGATVFLEPLETVEMGNRWREMLAEEQREVARILRELSVRVGKRADEIEMALDALAEIDLLLAKVRYGEVIKAKQLPHDPDLKSNGRDQGWLLDEPGSLYVRKARHPLIGENVVPIDVWIGKGGPTSNQQTPTAGPGDFTVLLITGPNTGGKTVALKTVGLLALMAQAGIPVPADIDSRLPVFDAIYADIGDEQSIEQSLSTFSSHISNIISILKGVTGRSLVLLDELAAGTDPVEGAALAKAILWQLLQVGALTMATTHHGELKAFAHTTPGVTNASVEFDAESLSPTYRLHIGLPGQSNALSIAERLGMPEAVLEEARSGIDPDRLAVESMISDLHRHREEAEAASETQRVAAREAEHARTRVTKELASLEANRSKLVEQTRKEMEAELRAARTRLRDAMRELQKAERTTVFERAEAIHKLEEEVAAVDEGVTRVQRRERKPRRGPLPPIEPGDRVYLNDVPTPGEAISSPDESGELEVKLGALRARINVKQIASVEKGGGASQGWGSDPQDYRSRPEEEMVATQRPSPELDLRGMTVEEALPLVDQRLDDAARYGVGELRIIHGKGTGTLRQAVREMLRKHALVRGSASAEQRAGGDGVTVVEIAG